MAVYERCQPSIYISISCHASVSSRSFDCIDEPMDARVTGRSLTN